MAGSAGIAARKGKKRMSKGDQAFHIVNTILWVAVMFMILYPLYLVIIASISDPDAIIRGEVVWHPVGISFRGYNAVFKYRELLRSYGNSIMYTFTSVIISIIITLLAAYVLSRPKFKGKALFNMFFIFTMFFGGGLIPTFLTMRDVGLYNTPWVIILMGSVSVWNMMVARTFIQTSIPHSLYEASMIDGASHYHCGAGSLLWRKQVERLLYRPRISPGQEPLPPPDHPAGNPGNPPSRQIRRLHDDHDG